MSNTRMILIANQHTPAQRLQQMDVSMERGFRVTQKALTVSDAAPARRLLYTGWPNKNRTFLIYHIFAATTDIIMWFLLKCSEITAENNKRQFFKRMLNILCKLVKIWYIVNVSVKVAASQPISATSLVNFSY